MSHLIRYLKSEMSKLSPSDVYIYLDGIFDHFGIYVGYEGLEVRSGSTEISGVDLE